MKVSGGRFLASEILINRQKKLKALSSYVHLRFTSCTIKIGWFKSIETPRNFTVRIKSFDFFSIFINIAHNAHTKRKNYVWENWKIIVWSRRYRCILVPLHKFYVHGHLSILRQRLQVVLFWIYDSANAGLGWTVYHD